MGKKKGGKRLGKKQVSELLQNLFQHNPNETFTFKQIFKVLKLDTHPLKMLAIDVMEEMAWDDFLSKVSDNSYRLNLKTQVQEGTFHRKAHPHCTLAGPYSCLIATDALRQLPVGLTTIWRPSPPTSTLQ